MKATLVVSLGLVVLIGGCSGGGALSAGDAGGPDGGFASDAASPDGRSDVQPRAFPADEISGTRLRAQYWLVDDGHRVPQVDRAGQVVWFDTKLGVPCVWTRSPTGASYVCTPATSFRVPNANRVFFLDAACKEPARIARSTYFAQRVGPPLLPDSDPTPYDEVGRETACVDKAYGWDGNDLLELGDRLTVNQIYDAQQGCVAFSLPPDEIVRAVTRTVATGSELAIGHVERFDTGHRLSAVQIVSDDGARQRIGWYDNALGVACGVGVAADGKERCLPEAADEGGFFFVDATGAPLALVPSSGSHYEPGTFLKTVGPTLFCDQTKTQVFRVGAVYTGDIYVPGSAMPLDKDTVPPGIYLQVSEVAPEQMDGFEPKPLGGRLQVAALADAEGALEAFPFGGTHFTRSYQFPETLTDTTLKQPCRFQPTSDGAIRCVPEWSAQTPGLNCSRNVVVHLQPLTMCADDPSATFTASWRGTACMGGWELSTYGAMITPNSGRVGDCTVGGDSMTSFYEIGTAAPASAFAAATLHTE
jgi:hypothetical protein